MNPAIERIRDATRDTPYEGRLHLVGGIVRDKVMERPPTEDVDIVLEGSAIDLAAFLHKKGITKHRPVTYPRFGTAMVNIDGHTVELVSARTESYLPDSRKPNVEHAGLYDDVMRRDFTINTLLENLHTGEIEDPTGEGIEDISAGIIRTPTEPDTTFYDDPLRMLRAIRFAVRFGFSIEPATWDAILRDAPRLSIISKERVRDEFAKILMSERPAEGLRMLDQSGLLKKFAIDLLQMKGVTQDGKHSYDVWDHTLLALQSLPQESDIIVRLAVLFHDAGKPKTKFIDEKGKIHFYGHEYLGAEIARRVLHRLRFPTSKTMRVRTLVLMHMRIGEYRHEWKESAVKRLMRDAGSDMPDLLALAKADRRGHGADVEIDDLEELESRIRKVLTHVTVEELESPLDGREIMELLSIPPGTRVQEIKDFLADEVIEGRLSPGDKDSARKLLLTRSWS